MSIRQQAKILGIAPPYLSMMVNGKQPWKPEIKERYDQLVNSGFMPDADQSVNTSVNTHQFTTVYGGYELRPTPIRFTPKARSMVELERLELSTSSMPLKRSPR